MSVKVKNILQKVAGSLKNRMPNNTVPMAPIPVQTGYAVPIGMVLTALASNTMLSAYRITKTAYQMICRPPVAKFALPRQNANPHSHSPARTSTIQFITCAVVLPEGCSDTRRLLPRTLQSTRNSI